MNKTLIFREIIARQPKPVFNDYYAIERSGKKHFFFKAHAENDIEIAILNEKQLEQDFMNARNRKSIHYVNSEKIQTLKLQLDLTNLNIEPEF